MSSIQFIQRPGRMIYKGTGPSLDHGPLRNGDIVLLRTDAGDITATVTDTSDVNKISGIVENWLPKAGGDADEIRESDPIVFTERDVHLVTR